MIMVKLNSKKDYKKCLEDLLVPLAGRFSADCSFINLAGAGAVYPEKTVGMEAFARPLWGLVPYWSDGGGMLFMNEYLKGLSAGSNPDLAGSYWGDCSDSDQRFVEMAPIAFALLLVPQKIWEPLDNQSKQNLSNWLYSINKFNLPRCNWFFFRILVNCSLKSLGMPFDREKLESDLDFINSCYVGNGWYEDGISHRRDYYVAFAMHFYGLLYARFEPEEPCSRTFRERAEIFAHDFKLWFDEKGSALAYGRSLTYRFAQSAFWGAYLFAGCSGVDVSVIKGIMTRNLSWWLEQGIYDNAGILSVGYGYPNLTMAERYNAPGSPYWGLKHFLVLALDERHPFWSSECAPVDGNGVQRYIPEAFMLIKHRGWETSVVVPGMNGMTSLGHFTEKYDKFVYSSRFCFSVSHGNDSLEEAAPDSMLAFLIPGKGVLVRKGSTEFFYDGDGLVSKWSPTDGIEVETRIMHVDNGHVRIHLIRSDIECCAYDCGFSIPSGGKIEMSDTCVAVEGKELGCSVSSIGAYGHPRLIKCDPNTNVLFKNTVLPCIEYTIKKGFTRLETEVDSYENPGT